jgi:hypothetical protein
MRVLDSKTHIERVYQDNLVHIYKDMYKKWGRTQNHVFLYTI